MYYQITLNHPNQQKKIKYFILRTVYTEKPIKIDPEKNFLQTVA